MHLLRFADVPAAEGDQLFRYSRLRAIVVAIAILFGSLGLLLAGVGMRSGLLFYVAVVGLAGLLVMQTFVRARFRPTNWLVRAAETGIFVQFRSYLNYRFPVTDMTVAFLPYDEILSARIVHERLRLPDPESPPPVVSSVTEQSRTVVELEVSGDSRDLLRAIDDEIDRCLGRRVGGQGARTRYQHVPVRMVSPTTLQLEWKVRPGAEVLLGRLRRVGATTGAGESTADYSRLANASRDEQERRLRELVETGQAITAVHLARRLYGYDLTRAQSFVDGLRGSRANDRS